MTAGEAPKETVLVVGYFDVLGVEHVRALQQARGEGPLVAAVLPGPQGAAGEILTGQARAEVAAALRMVDYVLIAAPPGHPGDLDELVKRLRPAVIVRLDQTDDEADSRRRRWLIEHVQHGQTF